MGRQESWVTSDTKENFTILLDMFKNIVNNNSIPRTTTENVNGKLIKSTEQDDLQCYPVAVITTKMLVGKPIRRTKIKEYPIGTKFILIQGERWQQRTPVNLLGDYLNNNWIPVDITFTEEMCPEDKIWSDLKIDSDNDIISANDYIIIQNFDSVNYINIREMV